MSKHISLRLPDDVYSAIKDKAAIEDSTVTAVITSVLQQYANSTRITPTEIIDAILDYLILDEAEVLKLKKLQKADKRWQEAKLTLI